MAARHASETALAWFTLAAAATHFSLETWYHLVWGQPINALVVDYISVCLMLIGAVVSLRTRPHSAAGLLATGWAFALGFGWRSAFGRLEAMQGAPRVNGEAAFVLPVIATAVIVVAATLLWALMLAYRQTVIGARQVPDLR